MCAVRKQYSPKIALLETDLRASSFLPLVVAPIFLGRGAAYV